jgi:cytochrome P450
MSVPVMAGDFDVLPGETLEQSQATYADLRQRCPVAHTDSLGGFWALTRHADVARVAADYGTFSTTVQNVVPKVAFTGRRPPLHLDPPDQTPYRAALNPLLSAERVATLEPVIRAIVREELQPLVARGGGDICGEFSGRFPVRVFGRWMNLDDGLQAQLMNAGPAFIRAVQAFDNAAMKDTSVVLYDMAREVIARRKANPQPAETDPVSDLLAVRIDRNGQAMALPDDMIIGTVRQVLVVGIVAPMVMVGSMAIHLARDPALHRQLKKNAALIPAAVEEFLRLYTPYRGFARTPLRDVEVSGCPIRAGEPVALTYASANRDEAVFPEPDVFKLDRPNISDHLAFGKGPHYCAGAHLGRLELRVALEELLAATEALEVNGEVLYCPYPEIGPYQVPLRFASAAT